MADVGVSKEMYSQLRSSLPAQLPAFLMKQRWFGGKARRISSAELADIISIPTPTQAVLLLMVAVKYADNTDESYAMPVLRVADDTMPAEGEPSLMKLLTGAGVDPVFLTDAFTGQ
jgi:hypothetical protein